MTKAATIDAYLSGVARDKREALERLRTQIAAAAPGAEETISYALPAFRLNGKVVAGFGAGADHCALYLFSGAIVDAHAAVLKGYDFSKGTVRFAPGKPLPAALVKKLVQARIAEAGSAPAKKAMPKQTDVAVAEYLRDLKHPLKKEYAAVRKMILGASPAISEGVKWNAPSFRTREWFVTINPRNKESVQLVFHLGAKVRPLSKGFKIDDPAGLLKWVAKDRAMATLGAGAEIAANRKPFEAIVKAWIKYV